MAYSVVFTLPGELRDLLTSAPPLDGVHILTAPRRTAAGAAELAVQEMRATQSRPVTGGWRRESGSFVLRAYAEVRGAGEDAIDAARTKVDGVLAAASGVLEGDCTLGGIVLHCDISEIAEDDQSLTTDGHTFTAHATVTFRADVNPGA